MAIPRNILIVGGGVFGLSTALSLSRKHPSTRITLLEASPTIPNPNGSSVDTSRIVRADYANSAYTKLAAAAIDRWRNSDWGLEERYTQNGLVLVYPDGNETAKNYCTKSYENVNQLDPQNVQLLPSKKDVLSAVPAYGDQINVAGGYVNWGSGWSDAEAAVRYTKELLDEEGKVTFRTGVEVDSLLYSDPANPSSSPVSGVTLSTGETLTSDLVILATGAWTTKLLDLRGRAVSTGQALAYIRISDDEQKKLENMPTILNFATGIFVIPPRNNLLKIARHAYGYHNPTTVSVPGSKNDQENMEVSLPMSDVPVPGEGQEAFRIALGQLLPGFANRPFEFTRVCWYTDTPKADFIITHHPTHKNLFLATGGSGHAYKFLPILGDKVVSALEGSLEPELGELWKWPEAMSLAEFDGTEDGSRSGRKGLVLGEELARDGVKERRGSVL